MARAPSRNQNGHLSVNFYLTNLYFCYKVLPEVYILIIPAFGLISICWTRIKHSLSNIFLLIHNK